MLQGVLGGGVVLHACRGCRLTLRRRYDLYATVNHMGSIDGGHYVAHMQVQPPPFTLFLAACQCPPPPLQMGGSWYCGDDSRVTPKSAPPIDSSAYILFYRRTTASSL